MSKKEEVIFRTLLLHTTLRKLTMLTDFWKQMDLHLRIVSSEKQVLEKKNSRDASLQKK